MEARPNGTGERPAALLQVAHHPRNLHNKPTLGLYVCMDGGMYVCMYVCMYLSIYLSIYLCIYVLHMYTEHAVGEDHMTKLAS